MGFFRSLCRKLGFFESCCSPIAEAAKSCSTSSSIVNLFFESCSSPIAEAAKSCSTSSSIVDSTSTSTSIYAYSVKSKLISFPRVIYLPASPSSTILLTPTSSSSLLQIALISSSSTSSSSSLAIISSTSYPYDSYSSYKFSKIFDKHEFPRVVEFDELLSYLFLSPKSKPITVLTGSIPLYGRRYNRSRYSYHSIPYLTRHTFWPPPLVLNDLNRDFVIRSRFPREGWFRLTADASLKYTDKVLKIIERAGGGFLIRDSGMNPVCLGEIMFPKNLQYDIRGFEMLIIAFGLKSIGATTWFPLEISSDNAFIIEMLRSDTLWDLRHDLDALFATNLYDENLLWIYQKIMLTIEGLLIVSPGNESGEKWGWNDIVFTCLPREANYAADYLANTIQVAGDWVITVPEPGCRWIKCQDLHELLLEILDRDVYGGFVMLPVPGRKSHNDLKVLSVLARKFRRSVHCCSSCGIP